MLTFRSPEHLTARIDAFAEQIDKPRSEAIRQLVEKGLDDPA
jgi:predicted DNA-binding protein